MNFLFRLPPILLIIYVSVQKSNYLVVVTFRIRLPVETPNNEGVKCHHLATQASLSPEWPVEKDAKLVEESVGFRFLDILLSGGRQLGLEGDILENSRGHGQNNFLSSENSFFPVLLADYLVATSVVQFPHFLNRTTQ